VTVIWRWKSSVRNHPLREVLGSAVAAAIARGVLVEAPVTVVIIEAELTGAKDLHRKSSSRGLCNPIRMGTEKSQKRKLLNVWVEDLIESTKTRTALSPKLNWKRLPNDSARSLSENPEWPGDLGVNALGVCPRIQFTLEIWVWMR
jgi:hypothetical protein